MCVGIIFFLSLRTGAAAPGYYIFILWRTHNMEARKRRHGDRRDGYWLRDLDALHGFTPYLFPNRADNEAFIEEEVDLTNLNAFLEKKNSENPEFRYTFFHAILAAIVKTVTLRPRMNRFVQATACICATA